MTFTQTLTTIFEILAVLALFWCFFHEDRLISFEKKIMANFRRRKLRVVKNSSVGYSSYSRIRQ